jgi:hypothetical protein
MTPGKFAFGAIVFHCVLLALVMSRYFGFVVSLEKPKIPWAWNCTVLLPTAVPTEVASAIGVQIGVGVDVGTMPLVAVGLGVGIGGAPAHTLSPINASKETGVAVPELPPPQLIISAAARKDSTGTSTRHRRRQIIKP